MDLFLIKENHKLLIKIPILKFYSDCKFQTLQELIKMEREQVLGKRITLFALVWPILIETFLRMFFGTIDTFMLSGYSDNAVAGVGAANQYVSILIMLFQMVSGGAGIIISQYLGAKNEKKASNVALVAIMFNLLFGILISTAMFAFSAKILGLMNFEKDVFLYSKEYLVIIGSFSFLQAASITVSAILRSHGHVKYPMLVNMGANLLNIIGNAIFIYGLFGAHSIYCYPSKTFLLSAKGHRLVPLH